MPFGKKIQVIFWKCRLQEISLKKGEFFLTPQNTGGLAKMQGLLKEIAPGLHKGQETSISQQLGPNRCENILVSPRFPTMTYQLVYR